MTRNMEKYKYFRDEENYTAIRSFDSSLKDKIIAILQKFFPDGNPVDRAMIIYQAVLLFQRYTSALEAMEADIHCYMLACLSIVMRYRSRTHDKTLEWHKEHGINLTALGKMENIICDKLHWEIHQLTPFYYMDIFRELLHFDRPRFSVANKLILETQLSGKFIIRKPSVLALSALIVSSDTTATSLEPYLKDVYIEANELKECVMDMDAVYKQWDYSEMDADPFKFDIDWLSGPDNSDPLDLSLLTGQSDPVFTFYDSSKCLVSIYLGSKVEANHPLFEDIYIHAHDDKPMNQSYVMRFARDSDSEEGDGHSCLEDYLKRWKGLTHPNIVRCKDLVFDTNDIFVMLEYLPMDLSCVMEQEIESNRIKNWMHQILDGVDHYHSRLGAHGHIRPESILFMDETIRIADFCPDKKSSKLKRTHDTYITYKAPEIILNTFDKGDGKPADIWAVGCLFGYFVTGSHLFQGINDISLLQSIFSRLGTPSEENWSRVASVYEKDLKDFGKIAPQDPEKAFCSAAVCLEGSEENAKEVDKDAIELLSAMLRLDPATRVTAKDALGYPYFKDFQTES